MSIPFPTEFQKYLNTDSFSYQVGDTTIRSEQDQGPVKIRRLYTKQVDVLQASIDITFSQFQSFLDFFNVTLNGGVSAFTYNHPFTGVSTEFRFKGPPKLSPLGNGGLQHRVTFSWEVMP